MTGTHAGSSLGESIRKGVGMIHGTGEAIRGNINAAVDEATGDRASATRNQEIAQKGVDEWDRGYRGHELSSTTGPTTTATSSTNYGPHSTNLGNKADPRVDSDLDHRGPTTAHTSTNYGPHSTNIGNKMDPRFDSDMDHRGTATGSTNYGPHGTNVGNKMDPRVDSDLDGRGAVGGERRL